MACPGRKPNARISQNEWYEKLYNDLKIADEQTKATMKYRLKIERQLDSYRFQDLETDAQRNNVERISRINDVAGWIRKLKKVCNHIELEMQLLSAAKSAAEMSLQNKSVPHDVNKFCLILRDRRAAFEAVQDSVEDKLRREAKLIETAKVTLNQKCNESFDLICKLKALHNELRNDLREKKTSISVDCTQLSPKKPLKPDIVLPKAIKGEEDSRAVISLGRIKYAEAILNSAQVIRDDIYKVIVHAEDAILNHKQKTDYEYHKRMHEIGIALEELQWQRKNIEDEIESLNDLLVNLQDSLDAKSNKLKFVETRMATARENKCSNVYKTLDEERTRLRTLQKSLEKSIANTKGKINGLQSTMNVIENNLRDKLITQQLDQACMEERKKVVPPSATQRKQSK